MPRAYEQVRDKLVGTPNHKTGKPMTLAEAKGEAAAIFNGRAKPGQPIVTSAGEGYVKKGKAKR